MGACPRCGSSTGLGNLPRNCQECRAQYCGECAEWRAVEHPAVDDWEMDHLHEYPLCSDGCALRTIGAFLEGIPPTEPVYLWNLSNVGLSVGEDVGEDEHGRSLDLVHERLKADEHEEDEEMTPPLERLHGKVKQLLEETGHRYVEDFVPLAF